jgi:hypothetical protein
MSDFLSRTLADIAQRLGAGDDEGWDAAVRALAAHPDAEDDVELFVAIDDRDAGTLRAITAAWAANRRPLPLHDRNLLKRALKAFRKRLKLVRLDAESSIGGGAMSSGRHSSIVGVRAPDQFPQEVWDRLVLEGRLKEGRDGTYELPPE